MGSMGNQAFPPVCKNTFYDLKWILKINPKGKVLSIIYQFFLLYYTTCGVLKKMVYAHKHYVTLELRHVSDLDADVRRGVATLDTQLIYLSVCFCHCPRLSAPHKLTQTSERACKPLRPLLMTRQSILIQLVATHYW